MRYALVDDKGNINRFAVNIDPAVATRAPWRWLPAPKGATPAHDVATQVVEGPVITIGAESVTEAYSVRAKTQQELIAEKDAAISRVDMVALRVAFNHENRIRVLENKAEITMPQFLNALKALL